MSSLLLHYRQFFLPERSAVMIRISQASLYVIASFSRRRRLPLSMAER